MKKSILILLSVSLALFNSCSKDDNVDPNADKLSENTVLITDSDWQDNIISFDPVTYTIIFDKNVLNKYPIKKGDIIVGTKDGGCLRKAKSVNIVGDKVTIYTEFAAITEAFKELTGQATTSLIPDRSSDEFWLDDGIEMSTLKKHHCQSDEVYYKYGSI